MIVFVQFPDDNFIPPNNEVWPKGGDPSNQDQWLDKEWTVNPTQGSLTDYFNQMSLGKLKVIGEEISLTTLNSREWYITQGWSRHNIHRQIIEEQLDPEWDFAEFDNWTLNKQYSHNRKPDGKIEFLFFIWRNIDMDLSPEFVSTKLKKMDMGWIGSIGNKPAAESDPNIYVDNKSRYFNTDSFGSGCTIINYFYKDPFRFAIHEFAHYLLGGNNFHNGHAFWAMLSGYEVRSYMINAWERHKLGWGNVITIPKKTGTKRDIELTDFITTGNAYRIEINAGTNEYFFLENHQGISHWDNYSPVKEDKGIFVIRQDTEGSGFSGTADWMVLISSEGRWQWEVTRWSPSKWGPGDLPVFRKGLPERDSGYLSTEGQKLLNPGSKSRNKLGYEIIYVEGPGGTIISDPLRNGKGKDAFRPEFNEVFTPWSNPDSQDKKRNETGIGFALKKISGSSIIVDIFINAAEEAPPSKPQGLTAEISRQGGERLVKLTWQLNQEPDVISNSKAYIIEKSINNQSFSPIVQLNGNASEYSDPDKKLLSGEANLKYRIMAVDSQGLRSVYSEAVTIPSN
jgi:M6 family metalloprotease-like protein